MNIFLLLKYNWKSEIHINLMSREQYNIEYNQVLEYTL
jgi:hypothetical protein